MKYYIKKFFEICIIGFCLIGCMNARKGQKIAGEIYGLGDSLNKTRMADLGISIDLPQNVKEITIKTDNFYQNMTGRKAVQFRLMTLTFGRIDIESGPIIWGEVLVYDSKQEQIFQNDKFNSQWYKAYVGVDNRRITKYDKVIKLNTPLKNRFGFPQKIYRIDRKNKENGSVLRATIVRALYAESPKLDQHDEKLIIRILESIRFE